MFETNSIQIVELTKTVNGNTVPSGEYTLAAKSKYFNSRDVAKEFLRDLTNVPIVKVNEIMANMDYDSNLSNYSNSTVYDSQINYLVAQRDFIINGYNNLINYFSSGLMVTSIKDDNNKTKTLKEYLSDVEIYFDNNKIDSLKSELDANGYVKDSSYLETIVLRRDLLIKEKEEKCKENRGINTSIEEFS
ncbi:MAG: hypothetical protein L6U99_01825 [Clostridium sp.]|nr:MAG: hypothetical protein L6U99_01825 [Clostridium sp.]